MKTINIKGKEYVEVHTRISEFRKLHEKGSIITEMVSNEGGVCVFKASVMIEGVLRATGFAYEKEGSSFINKTSFIENCETSAIGRALGCFGIGIDTSVASFDEVANAISQQADTPIVELKKKIKDGFKKLNYSPEQIKKTTADFVGQKPIKGEYELLLTYLRNQYKSMIMQTK
ncbi:MAG: hypothetical protein HN952_06145 [Candidatus Cloacimonetes bacterium]|jgi:hypothetical protein|nr:hypothetical protein [Candidatus Cloacimonadota bacterium]